MIKLIKVNKSTNQVVDFAYVNDLSNSRSLISNLNIFEIAFNTNHYWFVDSKEEYPIGYSVDYYGFAECDKVCLIKEPDTQGVVLHIDRNLKDITTCNVLWEDCVEPDIQWTNKLMRVE